MILYFWLLRLIAFLGHKKARLLCAGQRDVLKRLEEWKQTQPQNREIVWFHAASVGEFEQARPIIETMRKEGLDKAILLTFFSPSGYLLRKNYDKVDYVSYLPFATRKIATTFVQIIQPTMAVFVKYEFWPAYLKALHQNNVPTYIISAIFRPTQLFFRPFGGHYRKLLMLFRRLYVQDEPSRHLLEKYGITNVTVSGDTRFDRVVTIAKQAKSIPIIENFLAERPYIDYANNATHDDVIVAGSVYPTDEKLLARYFNEHPHTKLIIVPHEIDEEHLYTLFQLFEGRLVRYSQATPNNVQHVNVLVIDTVGILSSVYRYADVAYVGGAFNKGLHNTLEAAVYGLPVIFGPKYDAFREAIGLLNHQAAFSIHDYTSLAQALQTALLERTTMGKNAMNYIQSELGATDLIFNDLFSSPIPV